MCRVCPGSVSFYPHHHNYFWYGAGCSELIHEQNLIVVRSSTFRGLRKLQQALVGQGPRGTTPTHRALSLTTKQSLRQHEHTV